MVDYKITEFKYRLGQDAYYADLAQIKIHKGIVIAQQRALVNEGHDIVTSYRLDNGIVFEEEDLHSTFEDAKNQIVEIADKIKSLKEK